jgi:hypothetical protein
MNNTAQHEENPTLDKKKSEVKEKKPFFTPDNILIGGYSLVGIGMLGIVATFFIDSIILAQIALALLGIGTALFCLAMVLTLRDGPVFST